MKIKLDENLGSRGVQLLRQFGHDVATVAEQQLCSTNDRDLIEICTREGRCLVTLDMGFANPIAFVPADYSGIAVIRLPQQFVVEQIDDAMKTLIAGLEQSEVRGKLWVVQRGKIREYGQRK